MTSKLLTAALAIALGSTGAYAATAAVMECCCKDKMAGDKMAGDKKPGDTMDMPAPAPAPAPKK